MFTLSNGLSILRAPLAILFAFCSYKTRWLVVVLAMFTDIIDGYLARRYKHTTKFGAILDPLMDKFFTLLVICVLFYEKYLPLWEVIAFLSRDIVLFCFGLYVLALGRLKTYPYKSLKLGKITTALQFFVLIFLSANYYVYLYIFYLFYGLSLLILAELFANLKNSAPINKQIDQ